MIIRIGKSIRKGQRSFGSHRLFNLHFHVLKIFEVILGVDNQVEKSIRENMQDHPGYFGVWGKA